MKLMAFFLRGRGECSRSFGGVHSPGTLWLCGICGPLKKNTTVSTCLTVYGVGTLLEKPSVSHSDLDIASRDCLDRWYSCTSTPYGSSCNESSITSQAHVSGDVKVINEDVLFASNMMIKAKNYPLERIWINHAACEIAFQPSHPDTGALSHSRRPNFHLELYLRDVTRGMRSLWKLLLSCFRRVSSS